MTFFGDWILFLTTMNKSDFLMTQRPENKKKRIRYDEKNGKISDLKSTFSDFLGLKKQYLSIIIIYKWTYRKIVGFLDRKPLTFEFYKTIHFDSRPSTLVQDRTLSLMAIQLILNPILKWYFAIELRNWA